MVKQDKSIVADALTIHGPGAISAHDRLPRERLHYRALKVGNPNYFGNLSGSPFTPVVSIKGNTTYELIKCVGFHPQHNRLDAVVFTMQPVGYGGDVCSAGTPEYVRFYLSFDDGATWVDQGVTSFTAYDVPTKVTSGARLEHAVSLSCTPPRKWCSIRNVIRVRAILSWNDVPPPNQPNKPPVWGNVHDTYVQVDPRLFIKWIEALKQAEVKLPLPLVESLDLEQTVALQPKALAVKDLHELYDGKGVEPHRYAFAEINKLIKTPELTVEPVHSLLGVKLGVDLSDIIGKIFSTDGSVVYEELDCIGLRPNGFNDELVGVLRVKQQNGYSGSPCTKGSTEYVTFWGDFDQDGTFETCLGTATLKVFDIDDVPPHGLEYSVNLPVNLNPYRRPCGDGARVVPIRAILSWNEAPDCSNPDWIPTWGNREETLVLIHPGIQILPGDFSPFLYEVSNVPICSIDPTTGLAVGDRPFGGTLCITGSIPGTLNVATPDTVEYRIQASDGTQTITLTDPFTITVHHFTGTMLVQSKSVTQTASPDGYFTYREHGTPLLGNWRQVSSPNRLLAYWNTPPTLTGTWTITIQARLVGTLTPIYTAGTTYCVADGTLRSSATVTLDQQAPHATIAITGYEDASGFHAALPCGDFTKGVTIVGTFDVTDNMGVGSYGIGVAPNGSATVSEDIGSTTTHKFGEWRVDSSTLDPCGYVVTLTAWDRTIVNCGTSWWASDDVGFCLREPKPI